MTNQNTTLHVDHNVTLGSQQGLVPYWSDIKWFHNYGKDNNNNNTGGNSSHDNDNDSDNNNNRIMIVVIIVLFSK